MYAEAEKLRLEREVNDLVHELKANKTEEPRISNNVIKKLTQLLHEDNFPKLKESSPEEYKKIVLAMKIIVGEKNEKAGK